MCVPVPEYFQANNILAKCTVGCTAALLA